MKYLFITICCCFFTFGISTNVEAQKKKKANKLYDNFGYKSSIPLLEETLNNGDTSEVNLSKIANSYRLIHDTENAEKWYRELIMVSDDPIHYLHYAQALQSNGKNDTAKTYFLLYDSMIGSTDQQGKLLANAIDRMNEFKKSKIQIKNEKVINSSKIDFSPAYYKKGIVFVSTRSPERSKQKRDIWLDDNFMTLFYSEINSEGNLKTPVEFSEKISTVYHEGPLTTNRSGNVVFFTRSNFNDGKKEISTDNIVRLNIYSAEKKDGEWEEVKKLPFCTNEFDEMHPSLSSDGKKLYFSSNRDGGFGGMDIYVSYLEDGQWGNPINLGEKINTSGNDAFPFIHDDGTLYFSSNGWGGLGGLDIFSTTKVEDEFLSEPVNLGTPFNSPKDDFGFILNVLGTEGFLSSARSGGQGLDDIYSFNLKPDDMKKPKVLRLSTIVCTFDNKTKEMIPGVQVSVIEGTRDENGFTMNSSYNLEAATFAMDEDGYMKVLIQKNSPDTIAGYTGLKQTTDEKGQIFYELAPNKEYIFIGHKEGYRSEKIVYSTEGIDEPIKLSLCIPLSRNIGISLDGITVNSNSGNRIPNSTVTLYNHFTNNSVSVESNLLGEFSFPSIDINTEYTLTASKDGFIKTMEKIDLRGQDFAEETTLDYVLKLKSINEQSDDPIFASKGGNSNSNSTELAVGTVIELPQIYYDFDKYNIREGAANSLDQVVTLLRLYPSMRIELSAHTDSRGTWQYNRKLSKNRARYARNYILSKGISAYRLKASGWGESQLRNDCDEGVRCSEEQHQYNRRTEIKIIQFDRPEINVQYLNNPPEIIDPYIPSRERE